MLPISHKSRKDWIKNRRFRHYRLTRSFQLSLIQPYLATNARDHFPMPHGFVMPALAFDFHRVVRTDRRLSTWLRIAAAEKVYPVGKGKHEYADGHFVRDCPMKRYTCEWLGLKLKRLEQFIERLFADATTLRQSFQFQIVRYAASGKQSCSLLESETG